MRFVSLFGTFPFYKSIFISIKKWFKENLICMGSASIYDDPSFRKSKQKIGIYRC